MIGLENPVATGGTALLATLAIQFLKNSGWATWFNRETDRANLALSIAVAAATALGVHVTFNAATGDGALHFNLHQVWDGVVQWAVQHAAYKNVVVPAETLGEIRALLQRALPPAVSAAEDKGKS
jgi:hypothetical protein